MTLKPNQPTKNPERSFYDSEETVLVNKFEIRGLAELRKAEAFCLALAYQRIAAWPNSPSSGFTLTNEVFMRIHKEIFGRLYEWAGRCRTVQIAKGGMKWPETFLDQEMRSFEKKFLQPVDARNLKTD